MAVIDMATLTVTKYILIGMGVWHIAVTPEEVLLFTTSDVSNDVSAIEVASLTPLKPIKVGRYPWGVAVRAPRSPMTNLE